MGRVLNTDRKINKQAWVTSYKHLFTTNLFCMASRVYHTRQVTIALIVERKLLEMLDLELHGLTSLQYNKYSLGVKLVSSVRCDYI